MSFEISKNYLESKGFGSHIIVSEESTATVELAAQALGTEPGAIAKTLSFVVDDQPILILVEGMCRVDNKKYKQVFDKKAKMIRRENVEEMIGHAPGGVCPFGVKSGVRIYLDESLKKHEVLYPAAGDAHSCVKLTIGELETVIGDYAWVDVCKEA